MSVDNFTYKYWIKDDIKDCSNFKSEDFDEFDDFDIIINDEKLKDNYNRISNSNKSNDKSKYENSTFTSRDRFIKNKSSIDRPKFTRHEENKYNKSINTKKTNTYIDLRRSDRINHYNKEHVSRVSSSSRVSEYQGRNVLLDTCSKSKIKKLL